MNRNDFSGKWHKLKGKVKQKWGKLLDEDITHMSGKFEELSGKLQERYGWDKDKADKEVSSWCSECDKCCGSKSCGCGGNSCKSCSSDHEKKRKAS